MAFLSLGQQAKQYGPAIDMSQPATATQIAQYDANQRNRTWLEAGLMAAPATFISAIDTFAESLGIVEDQEVEEWLSRTFPELGDYFNDNRAALGFAGDIVGSFLPGALAVKAVRAGGLFAKLAEKTLGRGARFVTSTGKPNEVLFREAFDRARVVASKRGLRLHQDHVLQTLRRKGLGRSVADVAIETAAADAAIAATMHESDFLFPPELSLTEHIAFFGGFNVAFSGAAFAIAKYSMTRGIQRAAGQLSAQAHNPRGLPVDNITTDVLGERWQAATVYTNALDELNEAAAAARAEGDLETLSNVQADIAATRATLTEDVFPKMFEDSPLRGITRSQQMPTGGGEARTLQAAAQKDRNAFVGVTSLEVMGDRSANAMEVARRHKVKQIDGEIDVVAKEINSILRRNQGKLTKEAKNLQNKLSKLRREKAEAERHVFLMFELDGNVSTTGNRAEMYQDGIRKVGLQENEASATIEGVEIAAEFTTDRINVRIPSTAVSQKLDMATELQWDRFPMGDIVDGILFGNRKLEIAGLKKQLQSLGGVANLVPNDALKRFRANLPSQLTVYARDARDATVSLKPTDARKTAITVSRDDVWGHDNAGNLLVNRLPTAGVNSHTFTQLSHIQKTGTWDVIQRMTDKMAENLSVNLKNIVPKSNWHHTELDAMIRLASGPGGDQVLEKLGLDSIDELVYMSLQSKFTDFQLLRAQVDEAMQRGDTGHIYENLDNVARALNLPIDMHPLVQFFEASRIDGKLLPLSGLVRDMTELQDALKKTVNVGFEEAPTSTRELLGTMFDMKFDRQPVMAAVRNQEQRMAMSTEDLMRETTRLRSLVLERLAKQPSSVAKGILEQVQALPEVTSRAKQGLMQLVQGTENSGRIMSQLVQQSFRLRNQPGIREIDLIADATQKTVEAELRKALRGDPLSVNPLAQVDHQKRFNKLMAPESAGDQTLFFAAHNALKKGWDVEDAISHVDGRDGSIVYQFALKDTGRNKSLWRSLFNEDMPEIPDAADGILAMPDSLSSKPITITRPAFEALESFDFLSQKILTEVNALRAARGQKPVQRKAWHTPAQDFTQKELMFLLDDAGRVKQVVGGATRQEAIKLAQREQSLANEPLSIVTEASVERWHTAKAEAFYQMDDFSRTTLQTGQAKGTSVGEAITVGPAAFQQMLETTLRQFHDLGRETRVLLFQPEMLAMKRRKAVSGAAVSEETIWDLAINRLLGTGNRRAESIAGRTLSAVETNYDKIMQHAWDTLGNFDRSRFGSRAEYEQIEEQIKPEHNPFNDANDYMERVMRAQVPPELRRHAGILNEVTTALTIRIMDVGMAAINMATLTTTLPPVVAMLKKLPAESMDEWRQRTALFSTATPNGVAQFSPTRAVTEGMQFFWSDEGRQVAKWAADKGYFEQFAAEQVELFAQTGQSIGAGRVREWSDRLSVLTDKTERLARAVSWMTFYNMAKKGMGLSDEAAGLFAHAQANNVIADFRPSNRPVVFQGAAGMPLGLFTTFMWNYLQRIYSMVENKAVRAGVTQYGLQVGLFGQSSVPGWDQYVSYFTENYDGTSSIHERLTKAIGHEATEMFLNGTVQSLTGVSVSPRAAVGLPMQVTDPGFDSIPGMRLATRGFNTVSKVVDSIKEQQGVDAGRMAEILAASNLNKGTTSIIELAQGYALDGRDNVIEQDVRTGIGIGSRIAGFKPAYADDLRQENRRNRTTERVQAELKLRMGRELQSLARRGNLTAGNVDRAIERYVRAGGSPENFKRYFSQQIVRGTVSKLDAEIAKALASNNDQNRIARLMFLYARTPNHTPAVSVE